MMHYFDRLSEKVTTWLQDKEPNTRKFYFILGFGVIYIFVNILLTDPIINKNKFMIEKTNKLKIENDILQQNLNMIETMLKKYSTASPENLKKQLPRFVSDDDLSILLKEIMNKQGKNIHLMNLRSLPPTLWVPQDIQTEAVQLHQVYQHRIQIELTGAYFDILDYLKRLETIPYRIYWDNINIKVLHYPDIAVTIHLYIFSTQKERS